MKHWRSASGNWWLAVVAAFLSGAFGGCGDTSSVNDGQTHWLERCNESADCQPDLSCQCGRCVQPCDDADACGVVTTDGSCEAADSAAVLALCGDQEAQALCFARCTGPSDCASEQDCLDGACVPRASGGDSDCFSPEQNVDQAYSGAQGCSCDPTLDKDVCVQDSTGRAVALICSTGRWEAVEDGPCSPPPTASCTDDSCGADRICAEVVPGGFRACVGRLREATSCMNPSLDECCDSSECDKGICALSISYPSGPCGLGGADSLNQCLADDCGTNDDCSSGSVCAWQGLDGVQRRCLPAQCQSDADCNAAPFGRCALIGEGCLNIAGGSEYREPQLACIYAGDYCLADVDCDSGGATPNNCVIENGRARCQSVE